MKKSDLIIIFVFVITALAIFMGSNGQLAAHERCEADNGIYVGTTCFDRSAVLWEKNDVQD